MMVVKKYEIDMLNVGAADACLIHFFDEAGNSYVVLIDAGRERENLERHYIDMMYDHEHIVSLLKV